MNDIYISNIKTNYDRNYFCEMRVRKRLVPREGQNYTFVITICIKRQYKTNDKSYYDKINFFQKLIWFVLEKK